MPILTADDFDFFDENGYLRIPELIPADECDAVIDAMFWFLEMDRNDPEDWYRLPLKPGGMIEMYQHQALWNVRQNPRLHQALADLLGTPELAVSIDRVGFKPPQNPAHPDYDHKGFTHWDTDTNRAHIGRDGSLALKAKPGDDTPPRPFGVQGVLYLSDTEANMGGFQCIPGFHKHLDDWIAMQPADRNPRAPNMKDLTVEPIPGKRGDFVIWDVLLVHGNGHNVSSKPRFSQYVSMYPAERMSVESREHRIDCWRNRLPPGDNTFPGDPREVEQQRGTTAELTPLGRKLLGLDTW